MKNNTRDRLIDLIRQSHCVEVWDYYNDDFKEPDPVEELADHIIKNDVVPVVRCKDCKYHHWEKEPEHGKTIHFCSVLNAEVFKDFYCYHGTSKERGGSRNERNYIQRKTDR